MSVCRPLSDFDGGAHETGPGGAGRPRCPAHRCYMVLRPEGRQTYEQRFCGTWYDCDVLRCRASVLYPSRELGA